jgi:hypothetical protein
MDTAGAGIEGLLAALEDGPAADGGPGREFSIVTFETVDRLHPEERRKLVAWGDLVLQTCLPASVRFAAFEPRYACLAVMSDCDVVTAGEVADYYCEQLNKLPAGGIAPGRGWQAAARTYRADPAVIEAIVARLSAP